MEIITKELRLNTFQNQKAWYFTEPKTTSVMTRDQVKVCDSAKVQFSSDACWISGSGLSALAVPSEYELARATTVGSQRVATSHGSFTDTDDVYRHSERKTAWIDWSHSLIALELETKCNGEA